VPFPKFQAFLYALTQTAVGILRSDSGQSIIGAEKEKRQGRHIEMTLNLWSILTLSVSSDTN